MKTVLYIYNDYYPPVVGGVEKHIGTICEGLKNDFSLKVLVCSRRIFGFKEYINGVPVRRVGEFGRFQSAPVAPSMIYWLGKVKADIFHFHLPCPTGVISWFFRRPKGKIVVTYHSDVIRQKKTLLLYKPFLYKFLDSVDRIIVTSSNYLNSSPHLKYFRDKCVIIPLGIDIERFVNFNLESLYPKPYVLFVGKLRYYKGLQYLIEAIKDLDINLLIIGSGKEEYNLKRMVLERGLLEKVVFLGEILDEELFRYYANATAFVLPSIYRSEAFGIVILEAMASGIPVITTSIGTATDWINVHQETGLVVPPGDVKALREAISHIVNHPELREEMGRRARERVKNFFTKKRMLESIKNLYNELL